MIRAEDLKKLLENVPDYYVISLWVYKNPWSKASGMIDKDNEIFHLEFGEKDND